MNLSSLTAMEVFSLCKERTEEELIKWMKKDLNYYEINGEHDPNYLQQIKEARNFYYFILWKMDEEENK